VRVGQALILVALLSGGFLIGGSAFQIGGTTVYETQTPYAQLSVVDDDGVRTMYLGSAPQSATYLDGREGYVFEYSSYLHIPLLLQEDVDRVLFIGGGGFSTPKRYLEEYPTVTVDVVELDPKVIDVAREYFGLPTSDRLNVIEADGREFLEQTDREYDVIVLDAYRKDRVPFHMTTAEFFSLAASRLDDDGAMVANVIATDSGPGSEFYRSEFKTMQTAFPHVYAFPTSDTPFLQNIELVATKREDGFTRAELRRLDDEREVGVDLSGAISRYRAAEDVRTGDVPVLRDDRAPVDGLIDAQLGRRYVIARGDRNDTPVARSA
jgi:spermidine synthase